MAADDDAPTKLRPKRDLLSLESMFPSPFPLSQLLGSKVVQQVQSW